MDLANIPQIAPFHVDSDVTSLAQRWKRWSDRFDNLMVAMNVADNARKKALLLHLAGDAVFSIFEGLVVADIAHDADPEVDNVYTVAKRALDLHFNPQKNVEFERYTFRLAKQQPTENIDSYHARLRTLAKYCEFGDVDAEIKSHVIQTCRSTRLRRRALTETLTLLQLIDLGRSMETSERQTKAIESGPAISVSSADTTVARIATRQQHTPTSGHPQRVTSRPSSDRCRNCGRQYPHEGGRTGCPAFNTVCHTCNRRGHWARCCRSTSGSGASYGASRQPPPPSGRYQATERQQTVASYPSRGRGGRGRGGGQQQQRVNQIDQAVEEQSDQSDDNGYVFSLRSQNALQPRTIKQSTYEVTSSLSSLTQARLSTSSMKQRTIRSEIHRNLAKQRPVFLRMEPTHPCLF